MKQQVNKARCDNWPRRYSVNMACVCIHEDGERVNSKWTEVKLGETLAVPVRVSLIVHHSNVARIITRFQNAFSMCLSEQGFDFYRMLVPDLMHEFELGVWKAIFTHLMSILYANGSNSIQVLNKRYIVS